MSIRNLILIIACAGCTRITDGVTDTINLNLTDAPFGAHQQLLHSGDGSTWAAGVDVNNDNSSFTFGQETILLSREHFASATGWSADWSVNVSLAQNSNGSPCNPFYTATRVELAAHPSLDVLYWAGGLFHFDGNCSGGSSPFIPSIEVLTSAISTDPTQLTSALGTTIHPAIGKCCCDPAIIPNQCPMTCNTTPEACAGNCTCNINAVPYDPENWQCNGNAAPPGSHGQVPLALKAYHDPIASVAAGTSVDRLLAFIPHGLLDAGSSQQPYSCNNGGSSVSARKHDRALAFFDLDPTDGSIQDACHSATTKLGFAVTDPSWLIDIPNGVISAGSEMPSWALPGSTNFTGQYISADARLFNAMQCSGPNCNNNGCPGTNCNPTSGATNFMTPNFMPAPPVILLDPAGGRGYVFFNRFVGDLPSGGGNTCSEMPGSSSCEWQNPWQSGGHALVLSFSLTRPTSATGCMRDGAATGSDPFHGMAAPDASMASATLSPTAGVEPVSLTQTYDQSFLNNQNNCGVFSGNQNNGQNNGHGNVACFTDEIPYQPVALDTAGQHLLVTQTGTDQVIVLSTVDLSTLATLTVGHAPVAVALDAANRAYVVNRDSDSLSVIDLTALKVMREVKVGSIPVALYVDKGRASGPLVYVVDLMGDNIAIYDPVKNSVRFAPTCQRPAELFVDETNRQAVISCRGTLVYRAENPDGPPSDFTKVLPRTQSFKLLD